jgi:hypothetical protein
MAFNIKKSYLSRNFHPCGLYPTKLDLFLRKLTSVQILSISSNHVYSPRICLMNPFKYYPKSCPSKREVSVVQSKQDNLVSAVLSLPGVKLTPSLSFSPNSQEQSCRSSQDPHWKFFGSSVESWSSWVNSTAEQLVSPLPLRFSPSQDILTPSSDLLMLLIDSKLLQCIASFHVLEHSPTISLRILG